jgi:acid stress-induced BolA-like protein IbaG/YrbA
MKLVPLLLCIAMFSPLARAFAGTRPTQQLARPAFARLFSTTGAETTSTGPSIVDICQQKIQEALGADSVQVTGAYDDPNGSHISIQVVSDKFEGKRPMQRQQMVYKVCVYWCVRKEAIEKCRL